MPDRSHPEHPDQPEQALVVVPDEPGHLDAAAAGTLYCQRRGYELYGVAVGTDRERWAQVRELACREDLVVVVPSMAVLDPGRPGRVESVTGEFQVPPQVAAAEPPGRGSRRLMRTRLMRRW